MAALLVVVVATGALWMSSMLPGMEGARQGIVSFELARTSERAAEIVDAWRSAGRIDEARLQLWIDYGYMLAYGLLLAIGCLWARDRFVSHGRTRAARLAHLGVWGVCVAVACDAVENALLFAVIRDPASHAIGWATAAAGAKFTLVIAAMGVITWATCATRRSRSSRARGVGGGEPAPA